MPEGRKFTRQNPTEAPVGDPALTEQPNDNQPQDHQGQPPAEAAVQSQPNAPLGEFVKPEPKPVPTESPIGDSKSQDIKQPGKPVPPEDRMEPHERRFYRSMKNDFNCNAVMQDRDFEFLFGLVDKHLPDPDPTELEASTPKTVSSAGAIS